MGWRYRADCKFTWLCVALMSIILLFLIALLLGIVIHSECRAGRRLGLGWRTRNRLRVGEGHPGVCSLRGEGDPMHRSKGDFHVRGVWQYHCPWESRAGSPGGCTPVGAQGWVGFLSPFPAPQPSLPAGAERSLLFPGHRADIPTPTRHPGHGPARPWHCHHHHSTHPKGPPGPQNCCHPNRELAAHGPHRSPG